MSTTAADLKFEPIVSGSAQNQRQHIAPFGWLRKGIEDFRAIPALSILYGLLFSGLLGCLYLLLRESPGFTVAYITGMVFLGPFLASGLYIASRDLERGKKPGIRRSFRLLRRRATYIALFSLSLTLVMAAWVRFSALLFAIKFSAVNPSVEAYFSAATSPDGWIAIAFYAAVGLLLSVIVFTISAVSIPLIIDRDRNFMSAMKRSSEVVVRNPGVMLLWAGIIVVLTFVGVATAFVAFSVIFPILGYATWHSYRELVD